MTGGGTVWKKSTVEKEKGMARGVSERKMRVNGKRGEEGTAGIECLRPNMLGGLRLWDERNWSHCFRLSLPSCFFPPISLYFKIFFFFTFVSAVYLFLTGMLILKSSFLTSLSFIPPSVVLTASRRLPLSFPSIYSSISPPVLSIYLSVCLSVCSSLFTLWSSNTANISSPPQTTWASLFPSFFIPCSFKCD